MPLTVAVTDSNLLQLRDRVEHALPPGTVVRWLAGARADDLAAGLADADVLAGPVLTREMAASAPRLRLVQVVGAGLDGVDREALGPGVALANTFHHEDAMAEYAVWAAVDLRRGLGAADRALRNGVWQSPAQEPGRTLPQGLAGARVGLFGFGHVGERAWRAFHHFGARGAAVSGSGRVDAGAHGLDWAAGPEGLDRLCAESDVLVVSVPLGDATRGIIEAARLDALGPAGVLVHVARGPVVDEDALYAALRDGRLGGAAIDVWYAYPPAPGTPTQPSAHPFGDLPNVLMTPHVSGVALGTFEGRLVDVAANVAALDAGRPLRNVVVQGSAAGD